MPNNLNETVSALQTQKQVNSQKVTTLAFRSTSLCESIIVPSPQQKKYEWDAKTKVDTVRRKMQASKLWQVMGNRLIKIEELHCQNKGKVKQTIFLMG